MPPFQPRRIDTDQESVRRIGILDRELAALIDEYVQATEPEGGEHDGIDVEEALKQSA